MTLNITDARPIVQLSTEREGLLTYGTRSFSNLAMSKSHVWVAGHDVVTLIDVAHLTAEDVTWMTRNGESHDRDEVDSGFRAFGVHAFSNKACRVFTWSANEISAWE